MCVCVCVCVCDIMYEQKYLVHDQTKRILGTPVSEIEKKEEEGKIFMLNNIYFLIYKSTCTNQNKQDSFIYIDVYM